MLKLVLTAIQVILCLIIIFLGYKRKDYLNVIIGVCLIIISLI